MPIDARDCGYLWDMLDAAIQAQEFVGSKTLEECLNDPMLQAAVERKIEIIVKPQERFRMILGLHTTRFHGGAS